MFQRRKRVVVQSYSAQKVLGIVGVWSGTCPQKIGSVGLDVFPIEIYRPLLGHIVFFGGVTFRTFFA